MAFIKHSTVSENTDGMWLSSCMGLGRTASPIGVIFIPKTLTSAAQLFWWPVNYKLHMASFVHSKYLSVSAHVQGQMLCLGVARVIMPLLYKISESPNQFSS